MRVIGGLLAQPTSPFWPLRRCNTASVAQIKLGEFGVAVLDFESTEPTDGEPVPELTPSPAAVGVIRLGKKILVDGAWSLARHTSYGAALAGLPISGVSIGVSHGPADPAEALSATIDALGTTPKAGKWALTGGKGVTDEALAPLGAAWPHPAHSDTDRWGAVATVAALSSALGSVSGLTFSLPPEATSATAALADQLTAAGLTASGDAPADVLVVEGAASSFDHHAVAGCTARAIVPVGVNVVSPRALADATRASVAVVPDFCSVAGQLLGRFASASDTEDQRFESIRSTIAQRLGSPNSDSQFSLSDSFYLAVCERAEDFMLTWQQSLPAARPIG